MDLPVDLATFAIEEPIGLTRVCQASVTIQPTLRPKLEFTPRNQIKCAHQAVLVIESLFSNRWIVKRADQASTLHENTVDFRERLLLIVA